MATRHGRITILTRSFGRGIDFVVEEDNVKSAGGVHVIQTFISEDVSESVQIEGRTARQGE
jgi:preprotein translocase subunit SecA